jgi:hypothetical protein
MTDPWDIRLGPSEEDDKRRRDEGDVFAQKVIDEALSKSVESEVLPKRKKGIYTGAPAAFALELACQDLRRAFGGFGCYLVGSALERPDWRDIDVRLIMPDDEFDRLFPNCGGAKEGHWEFDARWLVMTIAISERLSKLTGLPIDFQFQPQTHANERHKGPRNALGLVFAKQDQQ